MPAYSDVKKDIERFKQSCRMYFTESTNVKQYLQDNPWLAEPGTPNETTMEISIRHQYDKMVADTKEVEEWFDKIEQHEGIPARVLLWKYLVEGKTSRMICEEYNMNNRQLQYIVKKWLYETFVAELLG